MPGLSFVKFPISIVKIVATCGLSVLLLFNNGCVVKFNATFVSLHNVAFKNSTPYGSSSMSLTSLNVPFVEFKFVSALKTKVTREFTSNLFVVVSVVELISFVM